MTWPITMLRGYGAFYAIMTLTRDAILVELQERNATPARSGIVPGAIAWDECDQCGLLALSGTRFYLTDSFPIEVATTEQTGSRGGAWLGGDLVTQLIRCAPQPQGSGQAPSTSALDATAQLVLDDAYSVLCATTTTLQALYDQNLIIDYLVRQQMFIGPEGACVGSELSYAVGVMR